MLLTVWLKGTVDSGAGSVLLFVTEGACPVTGGCLLQGKTSTASTFPSFLTGQLHIARSAC